MARMKRTRPRRLYHVHHPDDLSDSDSSSDHMVISSDSGGSNEDSDEELEDVEITEGNIGSSTQTEESAVIISDTDVLDCPICLEPLSPPVYQCVNGHLVCNSCSSKINRCPSCRTRGFARCIAMEKVLESAKVSCLNRQYGCKVKISYSEKLEHEKSCRYAACSCPHDDCNYVARSKHLHQHFSFQHPSSVLEFRFDIPTTVNLPKDRNRVFLQERSGSTLFILNRSVEPLWTSFNVFCVEPPPLGEKYTYSLVTARVGRNRYSFYKNVEVIPKYEAYLPRERCFVKYLEPPVLTLSIKKVKVGLEQNSIRRSYP